MSKLQKNGNRQSAFRPRASSSAASLKNGDVQISDPMPVTGNILDGSIPHPAPNSVHLRSNSSLRLMQSSRNGSTTQFYADNATRRSPPRLQHKRSMNGLREASNPIQRAPSRSPTRSTTTADTQVYVKSTPSRLIGGPKREKSTLKTVMRRLFGKKPVQSRRAAGAGPAEHHRSVRARLIEDTTTHLADATQDPGVFITTPSDVDPQRDTSPAVTEVTRSSALGSHSPFAPVTYNGRFLPTTQEHDPQPSPDPSPQRRRATLPSLDFTPDEARTIAATLGTYEHRLLSHTTTDERPRASIGFAVTSGSNPKRRSRSAGALRDAARQHRMSPIQWRRRSDEIRCWRESLEEPPLSSPVYAPSHATTLKGAPRVSSENIAPAEEPDAHTAEEIRRTFDFGPVASSMRNQEAASLEERLNTLEVKQMDLEYAISKLQTHAPEPAQLSAPRALPNPPSRNASQESVYSLTHVHQKKPMPAGSGSHGHSHDQGSSVLGAASPGTLSAMEYSLQKDFSNTHTAHEFPHFDPRPSSAITAIHPSSAQAFSPRADDQSLRPSQLTVEDGDTLCALLRREQAARKILEQQVLRLEQEVHSLRSSYIQEAESPDLTSVPSLVSHSPGFVARSRQQRRGSEFDGRLRSKRSVGDVGEETDPDETSQDVFETPKERTEFEPGGFF